MKKTKTFIFNNPSIGICAKTLLHKGMENELKSFYKDMDQAFESMVEGIDYRMYHEFIYTFSRLSNEEDSVAIYKKYKSIRAEESDFKNQEKGVERPNYSKIMNFINHELYTDSWNRRGIFSHDYMPPEAPRSVLNYLAFAFGKTKNREKIIHFFKENVFEKERLLLYQMKYVHAQNLSIRESLKSLEKESLSQEECASNMKRLYSKRDEVNQSIMTGRQGTLGPVYLGLEEGWRDSIQHLQEKGLEIMELEDIILELAQMEKQVLVEAIQTELSISKQASINS